ncbi:hypothetical protein [Fulvivirga sp.]|uniref:hypothetical protein n=1 Tax=Fulvivirga sp. TaxID=1931237 RepID=UPI0032EBF500
MKAQKVMPNMVDYAQFTKNFSWDKVRAELDGLPDNGGLNIAHEAVVRYAKGINKDHVAIKWLAVKGEEFDYTTGSAEGQLRNSVSGLYKRCLNKILQ